MVRIRFGWRGREIAITVPPTYLRWEDRVEGAIERDLREGLEGSGHRLEPAIVPKKLLATRSGLARYGRNNVSYVEGMGSFHRLAAFYSIVAADTDPWRDPEVLPSCRSCRLCLEACPTGAIAEDRFLLHAERCLTYWNEKPTDVPFPGELDPQVHEHLVGCMRCQTACPHNHGLLRIEDAEPPFTEADTAMLLQTTSMEALPEVVVNKVERHGLTDYLDVLPRNLGAALRSSTAGE
jgi:epoxyqueuosine reductase